MRFNSEVLAAKEQYKSLRDIVFPESVGSSADFGEKLEELSVDLKLPQKLREVGIKENNIPALAEEAMKQTRLLPNNPRDVHYNDAVALYKQAW
jgi:alcohol dehydrogenase class IV